MTRFLSPVFLVAPLVFLGCQSEISTQTKTVGDSDVVQDVAIDTEDFFSTMPEQLRGVASPGSPKGKT